MESSRRYNAVSPIDSRYSEKLKEVRDIFSYRNWYKKACTFEIEWLIFLDECDVIPAHKLSKSGKEVLRDIYRDFSAPSMQYLESLEETTNHDIKALEYYIARFLKQTDVSPEYAPFMHYCLTSNDTVITTNYLLFMDYYDLFRGGIMESILEATANFDLDKTVFITKTHGQPALPSTFHNEFYKYRSRLDETLHLMDKLPLKTKLSGAVGSYASFSNFIEDNDSKLMSKLQNFLGQFSLDSKRSLSLDWYSTQTNNYYTLCVHLNYMRDLANIMADLCKDVWMYVSYDYLCLQKKEEEVGSSTMPTKVNPIDFENAEGNFEIFSNWVEFLTRKLSQSRMQRDLSDSTVIRNLGVILSHFHLGMLSLYRGLGKITVNKLVVEEEVADSWHVMAEYLQLYLKKIGMEDGYEVVKEKLRGVKRMNWNEFSEVVHSLPIPEEDKQKLIRIEIKHYV
jgi:adenylosuccinate lyase